MKNYIIILLILIYSCGGISDSTTELSNGYYYASESANENIIVRHGYKNGDRYIPCNVIEYKYDDDYIIAKQLPSPDCFWDIDSNTYGDEKYYYWIIVTNENTILGPLSLVEFMDKRIQLNIPVHLRFKG